MYLYLLSISAFALKNHLAFLATWRFNCFSVFSCLSGQSIATTAAAMHKLQGGGTSRAIRCKSVISAQSAEPPAAQNCQFSGFSRASRQTIQREICTKCNFCADFAFSAFKTRDTSPNKSSPHTGGLLLALKLKLEAVTSL